VTSNIDDLLGKIRSLEQELIEEIQIQQQAFFYEIQQRRIFFEKQVILQHKLYVQQLLDYLKNASLKHILSAPVIWAILIPAVLLDITISLYQAICFPIYGIPKVKRADYIVFDRQYLNYLNIIEKINCAYCSYFNGIIAYIQEIAARTEQFCVQLSMPVVSAPYTADIRIFWIMVMLKLTDSTKKKSANTSMI